MVLEECHEPREEAGEEGAREPALRWIERVARPFPCDDREGDEGGDGERSVAREHQRVREVVRPEPGRRHRRETEHGIGARLAEPPLEPDQEDEARKLDREEAEDERRRLEPRLASRGTRLVGGDGVAEARGELRHRPIEGDPREAHGRPFEREEMPSAVGLGHGRHVVHPAVPADDRVDPERVLLDERHRHVRADVLVRVVHPADERVDPREDQRDEREEHPHDLRRAARGQRDAHGCLLGYSTRHHKPSALRDETGALVVRPTLARHGSPDAQPRPSHLQRGGGHPGASHAAAGVPRQAGPRRRGRLRRTTARATARWSSCAGSPSGEPRYRVLSFARNFGHQTAITAGLDYARGKAVVVMDADLQDPPEVVLDDGRQVARGLRRRLRQAPLARGGDVLQARHGAGASTGSSRR